MAFVSSLKTPILQVLLGGSNSQTSLPFPGSSAAAGKLHTHTLNPAGQTLTGLMLHQNSQNKLLQLWHSEHTHTLTHKYNNTAPRVTNHPGDVHCDHFSLRYSLIHFKCWFMACRLYKCMWNCSLRSFKLGLCPLVKNLMLFLPWDIVNIRKLKRNIVTSPSPICPCCMLNEKENSLSIIVIRTKRARFIAFKLTQWFSSLCRSIFIRSVPSPPPWPPQPSSVTYW